MQFVNYFYFVVVFFGISVVGVGILGNVGFGNNDEVGNDFEIDCRSVNVVFSEIFSHTSVVLN